MAHVRGQEQARHSDLLRVAMVAMQQAKDTIPMSDEDPEPLLKQVVAIADEIAAMEPEEVRPVTIQTRRVSIHPDALSLLRLLPAECIDAVGISRTRCTAQQNLSLRFGAWTQQGHTEKHWQCPGPDIPGVPPGPQTGRRSPAGHKAVSSSSISAHGSEIIGFGRLPDSGQPARKPAVTSIVQTKEQRPVPFRIGIR